MSGKSTASTNVRLVIFSFPLPPVSDIVPVDIVACDQGIILDDVSSPLFRPRSSDAKRPLDAPRNPRRHAPCWYPPHCECINVYNITPCEQRLCRLSWMLVIQVPYSTSTTTFATASYYPSAHKVCPCPVIPHHPLR
jgi:hypothetical protein